MNGDTSSAVNWICSGCGRRLGNVGSTNGDGRYYHPGCYPQGWASTWNLPIDYDRIRQIVREEIAAIRSQPDPLPGDEK